MTTAAQYMTAHAKTRASERYHVSLNRDHYWQLVKHIQHGQAEFIQRTSNTRTVWRVDGMVAVYSSRHKRIVTFLPSDCRESRLNEISAT